MSDDRSPAPLYLILESTSAAVRAGALLALVLGAIVAIVALAGAAAAVTIFGSIASVLGAAGFAVRRRGRAA